MLIKVNKSQIKNGNHSAVGCPIALALHKKFKVHYAVVNTYTRDLKTGYMYKLPANVSQFIYDYDKDLEVEPFSFEFTGERYYNKYHHMDDLIGAK